MGFLIVSAVKITYIEITQNTNFTSEQSDIIKWAKTFDSNHVQQVKTKDIVPEVVQKAIVMINDGLGCKIRSSF